MAQSDAAAAADDRAFEAMLERTGPAALKALADADIVRLMKDLRDLKGQEIEPKKRKALAEALRQVSTEKLLRMSKMPTSQERKAARDNAKPKAEKVAAGKAGQAKTGAGKVKEPTVAKGKAANAGADAAKPAADSAKVIKLEEKSRKLAEKAGKLEEKGRKLAEKAEKLRRREAGKAGREAAQSA